MGNDMHVNYIILIVVVCAWLSMHIKMLEGFNNELSKAIKKLSYTYVRRLYYVKFEPLPMWVVIFFYLNKYLTVTN